MKYSAICFDMDGVIINSEQDHFAAFAATLQSLNRTLSKSDYSRYFAGKTDRAGFEAYLESNQLAASIDPLLESKASAYSKIAQSGLTAYSSTVSLIPSLAKRYRLAVVTGSTRYETDLTLKSLSIDTYFSAVVTADDVAASKPAPDGYLRAAALIAAPPDQCIAVEDSPNGIAAAKNAGMYCIALTTTHLAEALRDANRIAADLRPDYF